MRNSEALLAAYCRLHGTGRFLSEAGSEGVGWSAAIRRSEASEEEWE